MENIYYNLRSYAKINIKDLSKESGIPLTTLNKYEKGIMIPSDKHNQRLAQIYNKHIDGAYIAGLFDRRSSITLTRQVMKKVKSKGGGGWVLAPGYMCRIEFMTKHKILVDILKQFFGCGSYTQVKNYSKTSSQEYHKFMAWSMNAERVCRALQSYIRLKRRNVEIILEARKLIEDNKKYRSCTKDKPIKMFEEFRDLYEAGISPNKIAKIIGLNSVTAYKWRDLIKAGSVPKNRWELYQKNVDKLEILYREIKEIGN